MSSKTKFNLNTITVALAKKEASVNPVHYVVDEPEKKKVLSRIARNKDYTFVSAVSKNGDEYLLASEDDDVLASFCKLHKLKIEETFDVTAKAPKAPAKKPVKKVESESEEEPSPPPKKASKAPAKKPVKKVESESESEEEPSPPKKASKAPAKKPVKKVESESESEESEEEPSPPKKAQKVTKASAKKPVKKVESESEPEEEPSPPKKATKAPAKKPVKKVESDSEEESSPPPKVTKAPTKKTAPTKVESESEEECESEEEPSPPPQKASVKKSVKKVESEEECDVESPSKETSSTDSGTSPNLQQNKIDCLIDHYTNIDFNKLSENEVRQIHKFFKDFERTISRRSYSGPSSSSAPPTQPKIEFADETDEDEDGVIEDLVTRDENVNFDKFFNDSISEDQFRKYNEWVSSGNNINELNKMSADTGIPASDCAYIKTHYAQLMVKFHNVK